MHKRIGRGCCVAVLILGFAQFVSAEPIVAHLKVNGFGGFPNFPLVAQLDAIITLEPSPGPFWWPWYSDYLNDTNGYLVTSLTGTWTTTLNGGIVEPATLSAIDPLRPFWMHRFTEQGFGRGYLSWATPSGAGGFHDEISRLYIGFFPPPGAFAEGSASALVVPEPAPVHLLGAGILAMSLLLRKSRLA